MAHENFTLAHWKLEKAKISLKQSGGHFCQMLAYGANTHNGIIRSYNEDRISIVLDLKRPDQSIKE